MPILSRWFIRAALLYLAVGVTVGSLLLAHKGLPFYPWLWQLLPLHIELLLFGWTLQLVLGGVAFWIFPRFLCSRGNETPAWLAFGLLNLGVWLAGLSPFLGGQIWVLLGRLAEAAAALAFGLHIWSRIKPPGVSTMSKR